MKALPSIAATRSGLQTGEFSAREWVSAALANIDRCDALVHAFTEMTSERALIEADRLDALRRKGEMLPPLAGLTFAAKNLFDIQGITTLAGARLLAGRPPAREDAVLIQRLRQAGAILTGALNMDAYAYGFTTENTHYGVTRNPHDLQRVAGGSSGGSGAAIAAGMVPVSLGSDTNGSIRVPASFCGCFGLKPSYGRLSRRGSQPFVPSLDHLGPFAANVEDLATVYDFLQGEDPADPACNPRAPDPTLATLNHGVRGLRIGVLTGHFEQWADADAREVVKRAALALGAEDTVELPHADLARSAAFVITASEGGAAYLPHLQHAYELFEPLSRDRLVAGAMLPAAWYLKAQQFRRWFQAEVARVFDDFDLLIAPATPCVATRIGAETMSLNDQTLPARASIGLLTQPISFIGLPVAAAPLWTPSGLPLAVQLIAPPWREDLCIRAARELEVQGLAETRIAQL